MKAVLLGAGPSDGVQPNYMQMVDGRTLLERAVESVARYADEVIAVLLSEHIEQLGLAEVLAKLDTAVTVVPVHARTAGAACTALLAIDAMQGEGDLLLANLTDFVRTDIGAALEGFRSAGVEAGTLIFESDNPRYSFVHLVGDRVMQVAEKDPISNWATAGVYWFRDTSVFIQSAQTMILKRADVDHQFYVAPTFNEIILAGGSVQAARIDSNDYLEMKPEYSR